MLLKTLKSAWRDYQLITGQVKILAQMKWLEQQKATVCSVFDKYAKKNPEKICFYYEDEKWTFRKVEEASNRIGNYFLKEGFRKNDIVALYMENRPEYVCTWLGLSKVGVVPALLNYNLRSLSLQNVLQVAKPKAIICGHEFSEVFAELHDSSPMYKSVPLYGSGIGDRSCLTNSKDLDVILPQISPNTPTPTEPVNFHDNLFYCFTSGTTGFPKAAIIKHSRFMMAGFANHYASELTEDDIIYVTLPLYHVAGGMLAMSQTLQWGTPLVIQKKFSASTFWKDCVRYNATAAQYIAETCRFLLRQEFTPEEKTHKVKCMFGNGLRSEIWDEFVSRFNITKISEFYASTEGNCNMVNFDNTSGAVGIIPPILGKVYPMNLIKLDKTTGDPLRDPKTGLAIKCGPHEQGELVGKIVKNSPFRDFKGYAGNAEANEKKIIRDVFKKGDMAFRTGDILVKDEEGYFYFKDRMGDTFRWKSENVSTSEVEYIISNCSNLRDTVVFGVTVPGHDGSAGMAVIADANGSLDLNLLTDGINKSLPPYARPVFIRVVKEIEMTGTHKMKKTDLQSDGYDLTKIAGDAIYFLSKGKYIPLTPELNKQIVSGKVQL